MYNLFRKLASFQRDNQGSRIKITETMPVPKAMNVILKMILIIVSKAPGIDCSDISKIVAFEQFGYALIYNLSPFVLKLTVSLQKVILLGSSVHNDRYDVSFNWFICRFDLKTCNVSAVIFVGILYITVFAKA